MTTIAVGKHRSGKSACKSACKSTCKSACMSAGASIALAAIAVLAVIVAFGAGEARAQEERACPPMIAQAPSLLHKAALAPDEAAITFVGHATFEIVSPEGVRIATDYNDRVRPRAVPTIVTMNRAHATHFTNDPNPGIAHVLRGWNPQGGAADHDLAVADVRVYNVPTNLRAGIGTDYGANSIFVFEVAGLCIAHLGHLHHVLEPEHLVALGGIDVVLAPVDGNFTLDTDGMIETLRRIGPRLVIPMHFFSQARLEAFLERASAFYAIARSDTPAIVVSRDTLPARPTVLVLPGR